MHWLTGSRTVRGQGQPYELFIFSGAIKFIIVLTIYHPLYARSSEHYTMKRIRPIRLPPYPKDFVSDTLRSFLRILTRLFRLQVFSQIVRCLRSKEDTKVALHQNRFIALLYSTIHICPTAVVLFFVIVNIKGTFIGSISITALTALQFAAKVLEILIQISLTTMLLAFIRDQAVVAGRLPFGSLVAPLNTTKVSHLWSLELWGSLTSECLHRWRKIVLSIIMPTTIILATLVGPSSAVLMIPRQIRYPWSQSLIFLDESEIPFPKNIDLLLESFM